MMGAISGRWCARGETGPISCRRCAAAPGMAANPSSTTTEVMTTDTCGPVGRRSLCAAQPPGVAPSPALGQHPGDLGDQLCDGTVGAQGCHRDQATALELVRHQPSSVRASERNAVIVGAVLGEDARHVEGTAIGPQIVAGPRAHKAVQAHTNSAIPSCTTGPGALSRTTGDGIMRPAASPGTA